MGIECNGVHTHNRYEQKVYDGLIDNQFVTVCLEIHVFPISLFLV